MKRSTIPPDRLAVLTQPQSLYVIRCEGEEYDCRNHGEGICDRGFFSLFLQVVYGISFAKKLGIPFYIDFGNLDYSYTEKGSMESKHNFWEDYFKQEVPKAHSRKVSNIRFENFPLKIWDRGFVRQLHRETMREIIPQDNIRQSLDSIKKEFVDKKILGVHFRKTDHSDEVQSARDKHYIRLIRKKLPGFDRLFVATDDREILENLLTMFPGKVFSHSHTRSSGKISLHGYPKKGNGQTLGREALLDCYSLSMCRLAILSPSNLSYCALLFNPELPYNLVESMEAKKIRYKTLAAYYLNKWGIRKW